MSQSCPEALCSFWFRRWDVCSLPSITGVITTTPRGRCYYCPHLTEETEVREVKSLARGHMAQKRSRGCGLITIPLTMPRLLPLSSVRKQSLFPSTPQPPPLCCLRTPCENRRHVNTSCRMLVNPGPQFLLPEHGAIHSIHCRGCFKDEMN